MSAGKDFMHVEFSALEQGQADFERTYGSLASVIDQLESELAANLSEWTGTAQQAFNEAHMTWNSAMANMQSALGQIGRAIGTAHQNYQDAERSVTARWS
ncbi:MAG: WXG100 family type VII secretion target [Nocardiopsaceae bacterium]|nr:WXG100 family type VII secretion target [Nocardiopsaceae bacterium]